MGIDLRADRQLDQLRREDFNTDFSPRARGDLSEDFVKHLIQGLSETSRIEARGRGWGRVHQQAASRRVASRGIAPGVHDVARTAGDAAAGPLPTSHTTQPHPNPAPPPALLSL